MAWGIVAMYLLIAIQVTSLLMRRLPRRLWHGIHLTSFVVFVAGTVHGFQSGADRSNRLVQWGCLSGCAIVLSLVIFRLATRGSAAVLGRDDIGMLAPGMAADFVGFRIDTLAFAGGDVHDPLAALNAARDKAKAMFAEDGLDAQTVMAGIKLTKKLEAEIVRTAITGVENGVLIAQEAA